jgi:hypothetical protein
VPESAEHFGLLLPEYSRKDEMPVGRDGAGYDASSFDEHAAEEV